MCVLAKGSVLVMKYETILLETKDNVATLILNRPETKNAMSPPLMQETLHALEQIALDESVRAVVLTGVGDSFTSGADLNWFGGANKASTPEEGHRRYLMALDLEEKLRLYPKPTVAAINGWALGWGFWLAMLCDIAILAEGARMGVPEINIGDFPAGGTIKSMITYVPHRKALYHLITGESINSDDAYRMDLVNKVVPKERLMEEAHSMADVMKDKNPNILRYLKMAFWREKYLNYDDAIELEILQAGQSRGLRLGKEDEDGIHAVRKQKSDRRSGKAAVLGK